MPFAPSAAQRKLRDFILDHPQLIRMGEICRLAGIPRRTYYFWTQDPGFCAWITSEWTSRLLFDSFPLLNAARSQAATSFRSWKVLSDLTFDPRGFAALATAQAATVTPTVTPSPEQNQQVTAAHCSKSNHSRRTPLQTLRLFHRACCPKLRHQPGLRKRRTA